MNKDLLDKLSEITPEEQDILSGRTEIDTRLYMSEESGKFDSALLLEQGRLITLRPHTRFVHFPRHTHNFIEMVYMCQGQTRHEINDSEILLNEGEILLLSQNATQEIYPADKDDIAVNFIILPQFFDTTLQLMGEDKNQIRDFLIDCLRGEKSGTGYLLFKISDILPIQNLMENLIWSFISAQSNKRSINQLTMGLLFLQLANHTDNLYAGPGDERQQMMLTILRYIEQHYYDAELRVLADELHCDVSWLSREIKKQSGKTFTELLQDRCLEQACFLLRTTQLKVSDICQDVGYKNFSYFHRLFLDRYGMTPKKYRDCK